MGIIQPLILRANQYFQQALEPSRCRWEMEAIYQNLFQRDLAQLGIRDSYYPVSGAANYSLLYAVFRIVIEGNPKKILELGTGQSTFLINDLQKATGLEFQMDSIEHNESWYQYVKNNVSSNVIHAPLVASKVAGKAIRGYSISPQDYSDRDFLIIDGPPGFPHENRFNRLCSLPIVHMMNKVDFCIIVDDAERRGERILATKILKGLDKAGVKYQVGQLSGSKRQLVVCGGRFSRFCYI